MDGGGVMVGGMVNTYPQWKDKEYIERIKMDKTAVVTIKLTEFELEKIIYSISKYIETIETEKNGGLNIPDLEPEYYTLKKELRNKFLKSPLTNTKQYAKNFENCLNLMWKTYLENK